MVIIGFVVGASGRVVIIVEGIVVGIVVGTEILSKGEHKVFDIFLDNLNKASFGTFDKIWNLMNFREAAGIWKCRGCQKAIAGGAWEFVTTAATTAKTTINRLKKNLESRKKPEKERDYN